MKRKTLKRLSNTGNISSLITYCFADRVWKAGVGSCRPLKREADEEMPSSKCP